MTISRTAPIAALVLFAFSVGVHITVNAELAKQPISSKIWDPFIVVGNLSGEVWLFSLAGDSIGPGGLVHVFEDCMASGLAILDYELDGDLDIVAMVQPKDAGGTPTGETDLYLLENDRFGFNVCIIPDTIPQRGGFWFPMSDVCAEDFLRDGYDDFVVSVTGNSPTLLHLFAFDPATGEFLESFLDDTPWASHAWLMDAGDVGKDSFSDFVTFDYPVTGDFADEIYLYSGDGLGGFTPSFACSSVHSINDIAMGDFDSDGCLDFVAGVDDDGDPGAVWLFVGDSTGSFRLGSPIPVFDLDPMHNSGQDRTGTGHMDAYDVDQDGNVDLVAFVHGRDTGPFNPTLWLVRGRGDGSFHQPVKVREGIGDLSLPLALSTPLRPVETGLDADKSRIPELFRLRQNSPNPFRGRTTLRFSLGKDCRARLVVQDVGGRLIAVLVDAELPAGTHAAVWDARAPAGIYFCRLEVVDLIATKKMVLLR